LTDRPQHSPPPPYREAKERAGRDWACAWPATVAHKYGRPGSQLDAIPSGPPGTTGRSPARSAYQFRYR
jgi:hypothetical protein